MAELLSFEKVNKLRVFIHDLHDIWEMRIKPGALLDVLHIGEGIFGFFLFGFGIFRVRKSDCALGFSYFFVFLRVLGPVDPFRLALFVVLH